MTQTAVGFFIFNRPEHTRRVFEAIARARPARLLLVADGPRPDRPDDARLCREARATVEVVDWPCRVERHYAERNLGCKQRIASGLDWVFARAEEAILLEDDCLPDPSFFPFCEELLARYRDDERVHMISGTNVLLGRRFGAESYYFSRIFRIWGWAGWRRAWQHYDVQMRRWGELRDSDWLERWLGSRPKAALTRHLFDEAHAGRINTWDFQWVFASWLRGALSIVPATNLVSNIGYDAAGAHERDPQHPFANLATQPMPFPLRHPAAVRVNEAADDAEWVLHHPQLARQDAWPRRTRRALRGLLRR